MHEIVTYNTDLKLWATLDESWKLFSHKILYHIGFFVIYYLGMSVATSVLFLGPIALHGPLYAGFFIVSFKYMRNETVKIADFGNGFNSFMPLFLFTFLEVIVRDQHLFPINQLLEVLVDQG